MPPKKTISVLEKKSIEKVVKKEIKKPIPPKIKEEKTPDIDYVLTKSVKYDINWYYLKSLFVRFEKFLISPYRMYEKWFNETFNKPKIIEPVVIPKPKRVRKKKIKE